MQVAAVVAGERIALRESGAACAAVKPLACRPVLRAVGSGHVRQRQKNASISTIASLKLADGWNSRCLSPADGQCSFNFDKLHANKVSLANENNINNNTMQIGIELHMIKARSDSDRRNRESLSHRMFEGTALDELLCTSAPFTTTARAAGPKNLRQ